MTKDAMLALAARCEALEGPESVIDEDVAFALGDADPAPTTHVRWYTASLDACRTLHERVLPGHRIEVVEYDGGWDVALRNKVGRTVATSIDAKTEEGGRLAALLRAKAKEA